MNKWVERRTPPDSPSGGKIYEQGYICEHCGVLTHMSEGHCHAKDKDNGQLGADYPKSEATPV